MKTIALVLLLASVSGMLSAQVVESTFEPPVYRPMENLWGQGEKGLEWKGAGTDVFVVRPNGGVNNSGSLRVNHRDQDFSSAVWNVPPSALGLAPEALAKARIAYRFSIKLDENQGDAVVARVYLAGGAVRMEIYSSGVGYTFNGNNEKDKRHVPLRGAADTLPFPAGEWVTVSGLIDFGAKTFTVRINESPQNGGAPLGMILDDDRQPDAGRILDFLLSTMRQTHNDWGPYTIDNVGFALVP